jgi:anti-anti-sigma factor
MATTNSSSATPLPQLCIDTSCPSPTMARITVVGEVDLATVPLFRDRLISALHDHTPVVDVDLAGVSFLDCTGIGALIAARNIAIQAGRQVWVAHPRPATRRLPELTGLLDVLTTPVDQPGPLPPAGRAAHAPGPPRATAGEPAEAGVLGAVALAATRGAGEPADAAG